MSGKLVICVVGLRFGATFAELYHEHPEVGEVVLCDPDAEKAQAMSAKLGGARMIADYEQVLADRTIDAVHLVTPIPLHVPQSLAALAAGKHVACAVPAATNVEDCTKLAAAEKASGKRYFMAETVAFSTEYLMIRELLKRGEMGRLQYLKGAHHQNMDQWPGYWKGLPPMWYATHAFMPLLMLAESPVTHVSCLGSGEIRQELAECYGSPFAVETAVFRFANGLAAQVERSLFETAAPPCEGIEVIGSKMAYSQGRLITLTDNRQPGQRGLACRTDWVHPPLRLDLLTPAFAAKLLGADRNRPQWPAFWGHAGSHPHLADEFVRCILENRAAAIDARAAGACCAAAAAAHQSALQGGVQLAVPQI